jgi:PAS domain S-box-containing protein
MLGPTSATNQRDTRASARIMIVEDEALIALDLERRLQRAGYEVVGVADQLDDAVALFRETRPELVLMDIFIRPPGDGIETARAIGRIGDVPVVFLTAYADDDTLRRAAETSPYGYLLKPFDERTLIATITVALERHSADTRLRLLGSAVDTANVGISLVDVRGDRRQVTYCNDAALKMLGAERAELIGAPPRFPCDDDEDPELERVREAVAARADVDAVLRGRTRRGDERWTTVAVSPVADRAGQLTHLILFYTDITEERRTIEALAARERDYADLAVLESQLRQRADELAASLEALRSTQRELVQREKLASLGVLVAGVAHEVNTPLGVAVTAASVAREALGRLDRLLAEKQVRRSELLAQLETVSSAVGLADTNLHRAAELVRHFKTVAVDQSSSTVRGFELGGYLREVVASLGPLLRRSKVTVRVEQSEDVPVTSRPGSLSQVITNFVTNALTHAFDPDQPGELVLKASQSDGQAVLEVRDDGKGMPPHVAERAFDPFFTTRSGTGGSGLGLFIVHNLVVEGLGGSVTLESAPGRGTTFLLKFPLRLPEDRATVSR